MLRASSLQDPFVPINNLIWPKSIQEHNLLICVFLIFFLIHFFNVFKHIFYFLFFYHFEPILHVPGSSDVKLSIQLSMNPGFPKEQRQMEKLTAAREFSVCKVDKCQRLAVNVDSQLCWRHSGSWQANHKDDPGGSLAVKETNYQTPTQLMPEKRTRGAYQRSNVHRQHSSTESVKCGSSELHKAREETCLWPGCYLHHPNSSSLCVECKVILQEKCRPESHGSQLVSSKSSACANDECPQTGQQTFNGLCLSCWKVLQNFSSLSNSSQVQPSRVTVCCSVHLHHVYKEP